MTKSLEKLRNNEAFRDAILQNSVDYLDDIDWSDESANHWALQGSMNDTVLLDGIANSSNEVVLKLLDECPIDVLRPYINQKNQHHFHKNTPLILSVSKGWNHTDTHGKSKTPHSEVIKKLVEKGALINEQDEQGRTALHFACLHRNAEAIDFLLANGARCMEDANGVTPMDYVSYNSTWASEILQEATGGSIHSFTLKPDLTATDALSKLEAHFPSDTSSSVDDTPSLTSETAVKRAHSKKTISREELTNILFSYQSSSFVANLSQFCLFSCFISHYRSTAMKELYQLSYFNLISKKDIEKAISKGFWHGKTRQSLFNQTDSIQKNGTGTDDVIEKLSKHFNGTPGG